MRQLQLVSSNSVPLNNPMKAGLADRLLRLNTAVRTLRALGYRISDQTLIPQNGGQPVVQIEPGTQSMLAPLLSRVRGLRWTLLDGRRCAVAQLDGVTITWEERV